MTVDILVFVFVLVSLAAHVVQLFGLASVLDRVQPNRTPCEPIGESTSEDILMTANPGSYICRRVRRRPDSGAVAAWRRRPSGARHISTRAGSLRISGDNVEFRAHGTWRTVWQSPSRRTTLVLFRSPEEWNRDSDTRPLHRSM